MPGEIPALPQTSQLPYRGGIELFEESRSVHSSALSLGFLRPITPGIRALFPQLRRQRARQNRGPYDAHRRMRRFHEVGIN